MLCRIQVDSVDYTPSFIHILYHLLIEFFLFSQMLSFVLHTLFSIFPRKPAKETCFPFTFIGYCVLCRSHAAFFSFFGDCLSSSHFFIVRRKKLNSYMRALPLCMQCIKRTVQNRMIKEDKTLFVVCAYFFFIEIRDY